MSLHIFSFIGIILTLSRNRLLEWVSSLYCSVRLLTDANMRPSNRKSGIADSR